MATTTALPQVNVDQLYRIVKGQLGTVEKGGRDGKSGNITIYGAAYGMNGVPYCSIGVWWAFKQIGVDLRKYITGSYASAEAAMEGWQAHGWKIVKAPRFMDVVFFHFEGEHAGANHTGFAIAADAGGVHTIEWNTSPGKGGSQVNGGGVYARYRPYSVIIGYGRWPNETHDAAPKAPAGQKPATQPKPLPKVQPVAKGKTYPTLHEGDHGAAVERMQTLLHVKIDGDFGPKTKQAVEAYQKTRGLLVDGVAGPATLRALGY